MPGTPVLHFSGRFRYHMPEYNNDPFRAGVEFDPSRPREEVIAICGCDPSHYLEFWFEDVRVEQVTYRDGSTEGARDPVWRQQIALGGFLVDVSPSSINARLFAGRLRVGDALEGRLDCADQSDQLTKIRPLGSSEVALAAHYETRVESRVLAAPKDSRYFSELGKATELEIYFQLNRYIGLNDEEAPESERLSGDVYGYLRPRPSAADQTGLRVSNRLLLTHAKLDHKLAEFVGSPFPTLEDVEGTYDLLCDERLVALRYLDFIPFLGRDRRTPDVERYLVSLQDNTRGVRLELGSFRGDVDEMRRCGGLVHCALPRGTDADGLRLVVEAVKTGHDPLPLMQESEWDLHLLPPPRPGAKCDIPSTPRGVVLPFGGSTDVRVQVFWRNRPAEGRTVRWNKPVSNGRSPVVDSFAEATGRTGVDGVATVKIQAQNINAGTNFPLDRYYGNRVVAEIDNPDRRLSGGVERVKIAVRVLHEYRAEDLPAVPSFDRDIRPLFSYLTRYYPWLHVRANGGNFERFLDVDDFDDFCKHVDAILDRLDLDANDPYKMPRSRDFPLGGADLIRKWKVTGMSR